ncbi:MAG: KpsF/GutQ family sugar-phosphate isomerase [Deltaproteobacteria bacterium]|jgi:arabinose-5-phosphate isomerase|nr:KpsF/GutQ family sugar-phosphate isomerase [Deltaproteobacteria bacterium]
MTNSNIRSNILRHGIEALKSEADAVFQTAALLNESFVAAVQAILNCKGRLCITGMGKAGLVGKKIQATFASTGTPSYFLHPVEALHGDIGMVQAGDIIIALSRSGSTEISNILPIFKKLGCKIILITAKEQSVSARSSDIVLLIGTDKEICPLGLAPSSTTTAMLALGDALALTVMKFKGITAEIYAFNHPGGALGRDLMLVKQIMRSGANCPCLSETDDIFACYQAMQSAPLRAGAVCIVNEKRQLKGILTQGDLFRFIMQEHPDNSAIIKLPVAKAMTSNPKKAFETWKVVEAITLMKRYSIDDLPVVSEDNTVVGLIDIQDLVLEGFEIIS